MRASIFAAAALSLGAASQALAVETLTVAPITVGDEKAVFGQVESVHITQARARIGGTVTSLKIREGDHVEAGQVIGTVTDDKLVLQLKSLAAEISGLDAQLAQAKTDLDRAEDLFSHGTIPRARLDEVRTAYNVALNAQRARVAQRAVIEQQMAEGDVLAPTAGRVLTIPVTLGMVVLPGEPLGTIAVQNFVLRLRVPERHVGFIKAGDPIRYEASELGESKPEFGKINLVYPQIRGRPRRRQCNGRRSRRLFRRRTGPRLGLGRHAQHLHHSRKLHCDQVRHRLRPSAHNGRCLCRRSRAARPARAATRASRRHRNSLRHQHGRRAGEAMKLGISGRLTKATLTSPLTPLFLLAALAMGLVALFAIPREEEPQISVPMVDITVAANGLKAPDAVELVTKPLEAIVKGINGVEHVYSQTQDDRVMVTARFLVGTKADDAILRVHEKIKANMDRIPVGIPEPLIVGRGINDVAIFVVTLSPKPAAAARWNEKDLYELADKLRNEFIKVDNIGLSYMSGGDPQQIRVEPDPEKLALYGVTLQQLFAKVQGANNSFQAGMVRDKGAMRTVVAGQTLSGVPDIGLLLLTTRDNRPVYVRDVAKVVIGPSTQEHHVWNLAPESGASEAGKAGTTALTKTWTTTPAVSVAFAKRAGANAVTVTSELRARLASLHGTLIPADIDTVVTRDYGQTANEKANELLFHLALATVSIVILIALAIGRREALVTLIVIPTTILLTLFAANAMGYTINRVSLFALIFSIGILVDDAIVVVENIARHWGMGDGRDRVTATIEAVSEVGNPTVVATLTVVAALLPMLFVSGLMGPYMAPIPANASAAMLFSFFVAMVIAPWLMLRLAPRNLPQHDSHDGEGWLGRAYRFVATPLIKTRKRALIFLVAVGVATLLSMGLFAVKAVTVKLLPFDNKSEIAVTLDLPVGASLEATERVLFAAARRIEPLPEVRSIQAYAGTPAPFNFNGLVRHYYFRQSPELGESADQSRAEGRPQPQQPCRRARHKVETERARPAERRLDQSGGSAARTAGARLFARGNLWARLRDAKGGRHRSQKDLRLGAFHRRCRRFLPAAATAPASLDRSGPSRVFRRRAEGCL